MYAVTSTQWNMARWQRTTGTVGAWPCGTHPHPNLTHNIQYSAFIRLPVACTLPTDSLHSVSHLWAPRQWRVLRWGHSLPQLVRFVLSGWKEPQEQGSWYYSPPESCCSHWTDCEPVECPVWYSFTLEGEKDGESVFCLVVCRDIVCVQMLPGWIIVKWQGKP